MAAKVTKRQLSQAARLFKGFREKDVAQVRSRKIRIPDVAVGIGQFHAVEYFTAHGKKRKLYRHEFAPRSRPEFLVSGDGRQLLIVGGRFRFTARGIVDKLK